MMYTVRMIDSPVMTWVGGICWVPIAERTIDSTTEIFTKLVTMMITNGQQGENAERAKQHQRPRGDRALQLKVGRRKSRPAAATLLAPRRRPAPQTSPTPVPTAAAISRALADRGRRRAPRFKERCARPTFDSSVGRAGLSPVRSLDSADDPIARPKVRSSGSVGRAGPSSIRSHDSDDDPIARPNVRSSRCVDRSRPSTDRPSTDRPSTDRNRDDRRGRSFCAYESTFEARASASVRPRWLLLIGPQPRGPMSQAFTDHFSSLSLAGERDSSPSFANPGAVGTGSARSRSSCSASSLDINVMFCSAAPTRKYSSPSCKDHDRALLVDRQAVDDLQ